MFNKVNKWQILERNKQPRDRSLSGGGGGGYKTGVGVR